MNDARVSSDEVLIKYYRFNSVLPRIGGMREICERACLTAFSINRWTRYLTSTLIRHLVKYEWKLSQPPLQALKGVVGRLNLRRSTPLLSRVKCDAFRTIEGGGEGGGGGDGAREKRAKEAVDESYDPAVNFYRDDFLLDRLACICV